MNDTKDKRRQRSKVNAMNLVSVNICGIHSSLEEALLDLLCKH